LAVGLYPLGKGNVIIGVTICDIWFQNVAIGIPLFLIMVDMNILVRAICSSIQTQNLQQHDLVAEHCITDF
jgi:hypothetical protein